MPFLKRNSHFVDIRSVILLMIDNLRFNIFFKNDTPKLTQSGGDEKNVQNAFRGVNSAKCMKKSILTGGNAVFEKKNACSRISGTTHGHFKPAARAHSAKKT